MIKTFESRKFQKMKKKSKTTLDADQTFVHEFKGHLISERNFGVLKFPKNEKI
jgi:hypothetical protein